MRLEHTDRSSSINEPLLISRRAFLRSATAAGALLLTAGCGGNVNKVLKTPKLSLRELPEGSRAKEWTNLHPAVKEDIELAFAHLRKAEERNDPYRDPALFEQLSREQSVSLRLPENSNILDQFPEAKQSLLNRLTEGQTGLFVNGYQNHSYVVERRGDKLIAIRQMDVNTGKAGFSNVKDSGGTPLGEIWISSVTNGRQGQVVAHNSTNSCPKGGLINNLQQGQSPSACIVTTYIAFSDYSEDHILAQRGIGGHGTNFHLDGNGSPQFNRSVSGGCIRFPDPDLVAAVVRGWFEAGTSGFVVGAENKSAVPTKPRAVEPSGQPAPNPSKEEANPTPPKADCAFPPGHPAAALCQ